MGKPQYLFDAPDLSGIFTLPPGYYGVTWVELMPQGCSFSNRVPPALAGFISAVAAFIRAAKLGDDCRIGCGYVRVMDAGHPENYMSWHTDNHEGGLRFTTSLSTDGAQVNLAWPDNDSQVGVPVEKTAWQTAWQAPNGLIAGFTTEPHGVIPQSYRPGERTANFFVTFYKTREEADLYTTNNTKSAQHAALPQLAEVTNG